MTYYNYYGFHEIVNDYGPIMDIIEDKNGEIRTIREALIIISNCGGLDDYIINSVPNFIRELYENVGEKFQAKYYIIREWDGFVNEDWEYASETVVSLGNIYDGYNNYRVKKVFLTRIGAAKYLDYNRSESNIMYEGLSDDDIEYFKNFNTDENLKQVKLEDLYVAVNELDRLMVKSESIKEKLVYYHERYNFLLEDNLTEDIDDVDYWNIMTSSYSSNHFDEYVQFSINYSDEYIMIYDIEKNQGETKKIGTAKLYKQSDIDKQTIDKWIEESREEFSNRYVMTFKDFEDFMKSPFANNRPRAVRILMKNEESAVKYKEYITKKNQKYVINYYKGSTSIHHSDGYQPNQYDIFDGVTFGCSTIEEGMKYLYDYLEKYNPVLRASTISFDDDFCESEMSEITSKYMEIVRKNELKKLGDLLVDICMEKTNIGEKYYLCESSIKKRKDIVVCGLKIKDALMIIQNFGIPDEYIFLEDSLNDKSKMLWDYLIEQIIIYHKRIKRQIDEIKKCESKMSKGSNRKKRCKIGFNNEEYKAITDLYFLRYEWEEKGNSIKLLADKENDELFSPNELAEYYGWSGEGSPWDFLDDM